MSASPPERASRPRAGLAASRAPGGPGAPVGPDAEAPASAPNVAPAAGPAAADPASAPNVAPAPSRAGHRTRTAAPARPREQQLRRAAVRLFREHGYDGTSMQDLAEALGMHRGSLYHYIASKEDLLFEIVESAMARFHDEVRPILEGEGPAPDRLRRAVGAHLRIAAEEPDELTLLQVELKALAPERRGQIVAERDAYEHAWRAFIREGMRDGAFHCADERTAGFMILAACNWFSQWYRPTGPLGVEEFASRFTDLFLDALRASPAAPRATEDAPTPPATDKQTIADVYGPLHREP